MNRFKQYGFKRKAFTELTYTAEGQTLKGLKYGYTFEKKKDDITITLNIIPKGNEWICERIDFNDKIFTKISSYKVKTNEIIYNEFEYAMKQLGYTRKDYKKVTRWAYMTTKEKALDEMIYQYDYLLKKGAE